MPSKFPDVTKQAWLRLKSRRVERLRVHGRVGVVAVSRGHLQHPLGEPRIDPRNHAPRSSQMRHAGVAIGGRTRLYDGLDDLGTGGVVPPVATTDALRELPRSRMEGFERVNINNEIFFTIYFLPKN